MADGLRERLVAVGAELVARHGTGALSLREVARAAGVSHGAPRRYFPTHRELLVAIAAEGYRELGSAIESADDPGRPPRDRIVALAQAFLGFATSHRGMFELMFRHDLLAAGPTDGPAAGQTGLRAASLPLFQRLVALVGEAGLGTVPSGDATTVAGALWANVFGIAQLWQWQSLQLATGRDDIDPVLRAAIDAHLGRR